MTSQKKNQMKSVTKSTAKRFNLVVALGFFIVSLNTLAQNTPAPPPAVVETTAAVQRNIAPSIWVPGTVISRYDSKVASETSGVLNFVVEVGDQMQRGDLLAKVNDQQLNLQLLRDQADLQRLKAQRLHAEKQLQRTKTLSQTNSAAQSQIDEWQMQFDVLQQEVELAKIKIEQTRYLLEHTQIIAPFSGIVAERFHQTGEHIGIGEEILRLVSTEKLEVTVRAPVEVSQYIQADQRVPVKNSTQEIYTEVRSIVPVGDIRSRMLEVRVRLPNPRLPNKEWIIGEAVDVALSNGPQQLSTVVPRDALVLRNNEVYLFRVRDGKAEKVTIVPGVGDASNIAVNGKLEAGDVVITRGAERLDDGQTVEVIKTVASQ